MTATTQGSRPKTMEGGTAHEGLLVMTPDGQGRVAKILSPDTVIVHLEGRVRIDPKTGQHVSVQVRCDLSECVALEALRPPPEEPADAPKEAQPPQAPPPTPEGAVASLN